MDRRKIQKNFIHKNCNTCPSPQTSPSGVLISQKESNDSFFEQINSHKLSAVSLNDNTNKPNDQPIVLKESNYSDNLLDKFTIKTGHTSQDNVRNSRNHHDRAGSSINEYYAFESNNFDHFLSEAGIVVDKNNNTYMIEDGPWATVKKMEQLLKCKNFNSNEILQNWNGQLSNIRFLERCLNSMNFINHDGYKVSSTSSSLTIRYSKNVSLINILLQVPQLQTQIINILILKINETIVSADKMEDVPWTYRLLQQLRFIGIINNVELLTLKLEELLETSPVWFQRELITFLPDIVIDAQHVNIAEILCRLMEDHSDLTNVILDCITNLSLSKEFYEDLRKKMLTILQHNCNINNVPAIVRFCLTDCTTVDSCQNVLRVIRMLELQPLDGENYDEYNINQMLIADAIRMSLTLMTDMANAAVLITTLTENSPNPFDLIVLLMLYDCTKKKKKADAIFKQHVMSGHYDVKLLNDFYNNYQLVAKNLQSIALQIASNLLKLDDRIFIDFSSEWFSQQFIIHNDSIHKQKEIIEKLILLMGNNDQTAKNALKILCKMTNKKGDKRYLQAHCNHLRILIEKVEKFCIEEVLMLNDLLYALCANSNTISDALRDDLFILLQKQLSYRRDSMSKCKGVAGAVMAIKHLATDSQCEMAKVIFRQVQSCIKDCPRSQGFFYDKIGYVIAETQNINMDFLKFMTDTFERNFINAFMTNMHKYTGKLEPTFGINVLNNVSDTCVIQFGQIKYGGAIVPALLRLMGICFMRINDNENVENISTLLGCAVLMPKDLDLPDAHTIDYLFYCVNWFRELINIFVTQSDPILLCQVFKRLDSIIYLQSKLSNLLILAEMRHQSPSCYFHYSLNDLPPLKLVERKMIRKRGKRNEKGEIIGGTILEQSEKWDTATLLSIKNPMYFRHLDAKILNLFDTDLQLNAPSSSSLSSYEIAIDDISIRQLCFVIQELIAVLENDVTADEKFIRDLITLLPKICKKLKKIVNELGSKNTDNHKYSDDNNDNNEKNDYEQSKQAVRLILDFLATLFRWKQFRNPTYKTILRDGLRILAGEVDKSNLMLSSCRTLVSESYRYFESLTYVATQIPIAFALVDICETLMKHSVMFTREHQYKQAKMAYGFLRLEWPDERHTGIVYKSSVVGLLKNWIDHDPNPLDTVTSVLDWLPNQVEKMEKPHDKLAQLPSINKLNFHHLVIKLFDGLIKGAKISSLALADVEKLELCKRIVENIQKIVSVCKVITTKNILLAYLRYMPSVLKQFLIIGMPILERNLRYQTEEITGILKMMQGATRYLNAICVHSMEKKDLALTKLVPTAKTILEKLLYSVKGMLVLNNSSTAFWMGNLVNKNLDGQEIMSQNSYSTGSDHTLIQDVHMSIDGARSSFINGNDSEIGLLSDSSVSENNDYNNNDDDDNDSVDNGDNNNYVSHSDNNNDNNNNNNNNDDDDDR